MNWASWESTAQFALAYAIFALSIYAPLSAGVLSVASISSGAIGGFLYTWLAPHGNLPVPVILLAGALAGGAAAAVLSYAVLHLGSHYLAMVTIAMLLVTEVVVLNATRVTGGVTGRTASQRFGWIPIIVVLAILGWVFSRLRGSRIGLAATVVREDPLVASGLGIDVRAVQRLGFILGGVIGGLGGMVLANLLQFVDYSTFYLDLSFVSLASVVLGSAYRWQGAVVGGIVFTVLPHILDLFVSSSYDGIADGLLIILIVVFLPNGIYDPDKWRRSGSRGPELAVEPASPQETRC